MTEIEQLRNDSNAGQRNPRDLKADLAKRIIADFHSQSAANQAEEEFVRRFRNKETPDEVEERSLPANSAGWDLVQLLITVGLAESKAEARRLVQQGGVSVDGERQSSANAQVSGEVGAARLVKVGKRRFVRVHFE
jgi:tyrosyl-tRNA synthetase